jgi:hypothetical protein
MNVSKVCLRTLSDDSEVVVFISNLMLGIRILAARLNHMVSLVDIKQIEYLVPAHFPIPG